MKNKKVKMKSLGTPTVMVFMHGFVDGRCKSAGISQDSGLLNSSYVNGKIELFHKYCSERVDCLETDIAAICTEAQTLLMELESMPAILEENEVPEAENVKFPKKLPISIEEAQVVRAEAREAAKANEAAKQAKANRSQMQKRKTDILQRLVQIRDRIANKETNCRNELSAAVFSLKERFCVYGHGVLLRPVFNYNIPQIELEYEWAFELYNRNHDEMKQKISAVTKKEED
ncbi:MAG: hypothetical protein Q4E24_01280 [bacterium]|nr:hypothetical protein [bacterium]